jgi:hypothetical protein
MLKALNVLLLLTIAVCAAVASYYWYRSTLPTPKSTPQPVASIDDVPVQYILGAEVDIYDVQRALSEASLLNKKAAQWST